MSNCWCKCEAGIGQCGPKVPRLKSLFNAHKHSDELSLRRGDRQAELQVIWEEVGEDKTVRLEELRQVIAVAVDKAYDKALEEAVRRRTAMEESVSNSEARLKELLGPYDVKAIAPRDLPLQIRLNNNMARLHELDSARVGGYGWVGGLVVMVELRRRLIVLRETLKLPPCNTSADLDEVLMNTMEALTALYPGKVSPVSSFKLASEDQRAAEQKPIFQRLKRFYQTLRAMENTWIETFAQKSNLHGSMYSGSDGESSDDEKVPSGVESTEKAAKVHLQELQGKRSFWDRNRDSHRQVKESSPSTPTQHLHYLPRSTRSKFRNSKNKITKQKSHTLDESFALEQLSHKIFFMLEEINKHAKTAVQTSEDQGCPVSEDLNQILQPVQGSVQIPADEAVEKSDITGQQDQESDSCSSTKGSCTPTSVLPPTPGALQSYHVHIGAVPLLWPPSALIFEKEAQPKQVRLEKGDNPVDIDAVPQCLGQGFFPEPSMLMGFNPMPVSPKSNSKPISESPLFVNFTPNMFSPVFDLKPVDLFGAHERKEPGQNVQPDPPLPVSHKQDVSDNRHPLQDVGQKSRDTPSMFIPLVPPPPPPPPPPPHPSGIAGSHRPPPPPPPPPGKGSLRVKKMSKLRRSSKMGVLYRTMKGKLEGRHTSQKNSSGTSALLPKPSASANAQGGMADALAEITKKSAYFQKIEDDVQRHAECILETKVAVESFQTSNMDQLLRFHESVEIQLEDLTDESQVLARFEGFPSKKLETIRLAAALYSKLLSMAQHVEKWRVDPPASEQLDRVNLYFEKVKKEVEAVERNKEDDMKRFSGHKIQFDFSIVVRIKEGMVGLASRCVIMALEESKRVKSLTIQGNGGNPSYELNRMKICLQMLWGAFQLSYRVYNFAGGCDDETEKLTSELANEMETYPSAVWV